MKTSEIKQILANDPNAVFRYGGRGRYTHYASIIKIDEKVVDTYNEWGRKSGTRVDVRFTVQYESFNRGYEGHEGYPERLPSVTVHTRSGVAPREIEWHVSDFSQTIEEYVVKTDAEVKADWQAKKDNTTSKQQAVNGIIRNLGVMAEDAKRWDTLNDDLMSLSLETLQLIVEKIASRV
jgi:hypothetical protein